MQLEKVDADLLPEHFSNFPYKHFTGSADEPSTGYHKFGELICALRRCTAAHVQKFLMAIRKRCDGMIDATGTFGQRWRAWSFVKSKKNCTSVHYEMRSKRDRIELSAREKKCTQCKK